MTRVGGGERTKDELNDIVERVEVLKLQKQEVDTEISFFVNVSDSVQDIQESKENELKGYVITQFCCYISRLYQLTNTVTMYLTRVIPQPHHVIYFQTCRSIRSLFMLPRSNRLYYGG